MLYGALEAGGTKMVCAVGDEKGHILERTVIPTHSPAETLPQMIDFYLGHDIAALGIACFGPIDLNRKSPTYGYITSTPKLEWRDTDIAGEFERKLHIPIGFDTDVNGSLLGEATWGCARGLDNAVYITIGTGVGGGVMSGGKLVHGMLHPELGHMLIPRRAGDDYPGICPYHGDCLEGLVSGPSIEKRYGVKAELLGDRSDVWELEAYYIAEALVNIIMTLSPQKIILGGGVMHQEQLYPLIRSEVERMLAGYIQAAPLEDMDSMIVPPSLNDDQGIMGAVRLAMEAAGSEPLPV